MRFLVVGTGSIGRRHIANLIAMGHLPQAHSVRAAGDPQARFLGASAGIEPDTVPLVARWREALAEVDAVVVANRTDQHLSTALEAARAGCHLFIEKPLGADLLGVQALVDEVERRRLVVECGFMLRMHPNVIWMREALRGGLLGEVFHARAAIGQWLADWRPGTDHRQSYSARRGMGGGVIFDLVHELDLVQALVAPACEVTAMTRQVQELQIETEAVAQIGLRLDNGALAQVHLDYVRPGYGREMEIVGRRGVLRWDYPSGTVSLEDGSGAARIVHRVPDGFVRNTMFEHHMAHFVQRLQGPSAAAASPLDEAVAVLRTALAAHASARDGRVVDPRRLTEPAAAAQGPQ